MNPSHDHHFMARAIRLANASLHAPHPNPRVGCVIVRNDEIVGEGRHPYAGGPHAEIVALCAAGEQARDATAYVTLEPCCHHGRTPPCTDALIRAGIARVVAAMPDPNPRVAGGGLEVLRAAGIEVHSGVLEEQARVLNPGFIKRMREGLPFVRSKLAMSLDGRTAMASGESRWITSPASRADVHRLRAQASAIMTGADTVLNDDPRLTVRLEEFGLEAASSAQHFRSPLRVVIDGRLRIGPQAKILAPPEQTLIFTCTPDQPRIEHLRLAGAEVRVAEAYEGRVDLRAALRQLAEMEVNEVLVEAGPALNGALLQQGLVDEIVIYMAPCLMGDGARGLFHLPGLARMDQRQQLAIADIRAVGGDWRIIARVARSGAEA